MKANEAPKKIYISNFDIEALPKNEQLSKCWHEVSTQDTDIEYIRTDYAKKWFTVDAKIFLSEIHRACDITDENGYKIELRDLQARFEKYINEKWL